MSIENEMHRRLRLYAGVSDDARVEIREDVSSSSYGGCEMCDYGRESSYNIDVEFISAEGRCIKLMSFDNMGDMIRAMDSVDD